MQTLIPSFCGFYESVLGMMIDDEVESICDYESEERGYPVEYGDIDYTIDYVAIAKAWLTEYKDRVFYEYGIHLNSLEFNGLESPKYYNYSTDKLLVAINKIDLLALKRAAYPRGKGLQAVIDSMFKSRDGFASFYDSFVGGWKNKPFSQWDENEVTCILPTVEIDYSNLSESVMNAINYTITEKAVVNE